jgi:spermidine synthase
MNSIFLLLTFISSFATMSYAMITASIISDFTGEEIYSQCLTMGPYLLGLGLGSILGDKVKKSETLTAFWRFEWLSVILLPMIPLFHIVFIFFYLHLSPIGTTLESKTSLKIILGLASIFSFGTGLLGGAQLPLIIREVENKIKAEIVLAVNYCGPLLAGPFIVLCNGLSLPASVQTGIIALIQVLGLILIIFRSKNRIKGMVLLSVPLILVAFLARVYPTMEYITVKASYVETKMGLGDLKNIRRTINAIEQYGDLERIRTPYQVIDYFATPSFPEVASPANFTLYLNRKTQFDSFAVDIYHQSMVFAGVNLMLKKPTNVLILGAGDGLLLKELKHIPDVQSITMVELDPGIIEWAGSHPVMSVLNEHSLTIEDPRVKILVTDAVSFLRTHPRDKKYDLILVDFPFPNGHELSKLYSIEFYELLKKVADVQSVLIIDMPIVYDPSGKMEMETQTILKTLKAAGFKSRLAFGPHASFLATSLEERQLKFDFSKFPENMALSARLNLVEIMDEKDISESEKNIPVNSMFWPRGL